MKTKKKQDATDDTTSSSTSGGFVKNMPAAAILAVEAGFKKDIKNGLYTPTQAKKILNEINEIKKIIGLENERTK